jgi:hypothetical protein
MIFVSHSTPPRGQPLYNWRTATHAHSDLGQFDIAGTRSITCKPTCKYYNSTEVNFQHVATFLFPHPCYQIAWDLPLSNQVHVVRTTRSVQDMENKRANSRFYSWLFKQITHIQQLFTVIILFGESFAKFYRLYKDFRGFWSGSEPVWYTWRDTSLGSSSRFPTTKLYWGKNWQNFH